MDIIRARKTKFHTKEELTCVFKVKEFRHY